MIIKNFAATLAPEALATALRTVRGTVATHPVSAAARAVLIESTGAQLWLATSCAMGTTETAVPATIGGVGSALIDIADLDRAVDEAAPGARLALHRMSWTTMYDSGCFLRRTEQPPHAVTVNGDRFRTELAAVLRLAWPDAEAMRIFGVRLWFQSDGVVLQVGDGQRMTLTKIRGEVNPEAVGRTARVLTKQLAAVQHGLNGSEVHLGISNGSAHTLVSVSSRSSSLLALESLAEPPRRWNWALFTDPAYSVTVDRLAACQALDAAEERAGWGNAAGPRPVVVHADADPFRITHAREPRNGDGRVLIFDASRLRSAFDAFTSDEVVLHVRRTGQPSRVIVTEPNTRLGYLFHRHHLTTEIADPHLA